MTVVALVVIWCAVVLVVSGAGLLHDAPVPMPILGAAISLLAAGLLVIRRSWRARLLARGVKPLIAFHLTRFIGVRFIILYSEGLLARNVALVAGWGEAAAAALAIVLLMLPDFRRRERRLFFVLWNVFALLNAAVALTMEARMSFADLGINAFASLPLSLLPLFVVPIAIATHAVMLLPARGDSRSLER